MNEIIVNLTKDEFAMIGECITYISANERNFNKEGEMTLKSIADKFCAEYIEEANINYYDWYEEEINND